MAEVVEGSGKDAQPSGETNVRRAEVGEEDIVVDAIEAAHDESYEDDEFLATGWDATSTAASTSVTSSVYHHEYMNGRRYHAYKHGRYPIPNDDEEQDREDMKHAMMLELTVRRRQEIHDANTTVNER